MIYFEIIGYLAIVFSVIARLSITKTNMRFYGAISAALFGVSIYSYGGINGAFVSIISVITKLLSLKFKENTLKPLKFSSPFIAFIFFFVFNEEGLVGILPAISLIFIIFADLQESPLRMKYIYFGSAICWFIYAIIIGSIPAILFDIIGISTLSYGIIKIKREDAVKQQFIKLKT